jgi:16S rRNA (adenine(1408)-N(1))-methyltransferase
LRAAAAAPNFLHIGIDPVATAMAKSSTEALRRRSNAIFALGSIEALPEELAGVATRLTVNLPWAGLLRAVAAPETELLANIATICQPGACLEIVYSASRRDARELARLGLGELDSCKRLPDLRNGYAAAGFQLEGARRIANEELKELGTTWSKRLWRDPERHAWRLSARRD